MRIEFSSPGYPINFFQFLSLLKQTKGNLRKSKKNQNIKPLKPYENQRKIKKSRERNKHVIERKIWARVPGAGKCNPHTTGFNRIATRKTRAQNQRKSRKSKEIKGNQRKSKEIKGNQSKSKEI